MNFLLVALGGSFGASSRYLISLVGNRSRQHIPWGTWMANILGSLILALLFKLHINNDLPTWIWSLFGIGFCGAFTTFSTFSLETTQLWKAGKIKMAVFYVSVSLISSLGIVFLILVS